MYNLENQPILKKIIDTIENNRINSQAYILCGTSSKELADFSILLAKNLICPSKYENNCEKCNICKRINEGVFPELKVISPSNSVIKKETIINLRNAFQVKSIEGKNQVYIINEAEKLNVSAANSILKFLEEPESNTIAIFNTTNIKSVINTIVSRCQVIKINNKKNYSIDYLLNNYDFSIDDVKNAIDFFREIESNSSYILCSINDLLLNKYGTRDLLKKFINILLYIYIDILNYTYLNEFKYFSDYIDLKEYVDENKIKHITKKISFILSNMEKLDYNVNIQLFVNNLVIGIGEIENGKSNRS